MLWQMWEREWGVEEAELGAPSLCLVSVAEQQGHLGGEEGLQDEAKKAL